MQLDWAPLCGSTMADKLAGKNWVDCLHSTSTAPWGGDRGFYILRSAGLLRPAGWRPWLLHFAGRIQAFIYSRDVS